MLHWVLHSSITVLIQSSIYTDFIHILSASLYDSRSIISSKWEDKENNVAGLFCLFKHKYQDSLPI